MAASSFASTINAYAAISALLIRLSASAKSKEPSPNLRIFYLPPNGPINTAGTVGYLGSFLRNQWVYYLRQLLLRPMYSIQEFDRRM